ncbi:MAG: PD40 domain-containing protein [Planctomycetes bacterium]|nr:PD40 domain-containing protein [Planctomycetota bacterium]
MGTGIKIISALLMLVGVIGCGTTEPAPSSEHRVDSEEIKSSPLTTDYSLLISQLGSDDWETREKAQEALQAYGKNLIKQYRSNHSPDIKKELQSLALTVKQYLQKDNPEIKNRLKLLLKSFYPLIGTPGILCTAGMENDIYLVNLDGSEKKLTDDGYEHFSPVWNGKATKIAFVTKKEDLHDYEISCMDINGSNKEVIRKKGFMEKISYLAWSPHEESHIIFIMEREIQKLDLAEKEEIMREQILSSADMTPEKYFLSWNRNRDEFVYVSYFSNLDKFRLNKAGLNWGKEELLLESNDELKSLFYPAWNPDGSKIAFVCGKEKDISAMPGITGFPDWHHLEGNIYILNVATKKITKLTDSGTDSSPTWSPDGTKIAFTSSREVINKETNERIACNIYTMNADGSNIKKLTTSGGYFNLQWSHALDDIYEFFKFGLEETK